MRKELRILIPAVSILLSVFIFILMLSSKGHKTDGPVIGDVTYIQNVTASVNGESPKKIMLPYTFKNLPHRTPVILTAEITPKPDDAIYIKSVYCPAKIYLNGKLAYEFGQLKNYPKFMKDPATEVHMVETKGTGNKMLLTMEFLSPVSRNSMIIHPPMMENAKTLISERQQSLGLPLAFSLFQIFAGISLIFISLYIILFDKKGTIFLWLGLFALDTGAWAFGENNFTGIIFKNTAFLYLLSFIGFFTFIIPLLRFAEHIVDFKNPVPIHIMELLSTSAASIAMILQFTGVMAFSKSMYFFHLYLPVILLILTILIAFEYVRNKSGSARRMIIPTSILTLSALLEVFNYQIPFTYVFSSLFQFGIILFLLLMGLIAGLTLKDSIDLKNKEKELTFEKGLMEIQIKEQQSRSFLLTQHEQLIRQQRHDLRHHLAVIMGMVSPSNLELQNYLQTLMDNIPSTAKRFCENHAVNSVIAHYDAICRQKEIEFAFHGVIPENNPNINDSSLCVIFGNLLENAAEACERMAEGKRFIRLNCSLRHGILTVAMDNSFSGKIQTENGRFRSSKRDAFGIGLNSIQSVAQKNGGNAKFESQNHVFLSSVYLKV